MRSYLRVLCVGTTLAGVSALAQSTATLAGTVKDPTGAVLPGATVVVHNNGTGVDRTLHSDSAGQYVVPSLPPGEYTVTVNAAGFSQYVVRTYVLEVDQKATLDVPLAPASAGQTVQVEGGAPVVQAQTITVGEVISSRTVQEVPLNGRHFLDLTVLTPGGVTAPQNGTLTSPSRGLGANSFDTAGNREDSVNFQINGVNLNDMVQNQITFQPSIDTTSEFDVNNQTYSAEYGRSSGSIVNVSTRSGTNQFHGEAFEYLRNDSVDARNYFNPVSQPKAEFHRSNFGGSLGGPIRRDHTFFFGSYEGLRQHQGIIINNPVLTAAQRTAVTNPISQALLQYIPLPNVITGTGNTLNAYTTTVPGPVQIDQGTGDVQQVFSPSDTLHGFYAFQEDTRVEPTLQGDNLPGFGDNRHAKRQILTLNETHVFSPNIVNEARLGFNRIAISFIPSNLSNPANLKIDTGITGNTGLPYIEVLGPNDEFGGPAGEPQGRFDTLGIFSDALTLTRGKHSLKVGGEFRRFINANFSQDPGTIVFSNLTNFDAGLVTQYTITPTEVTSRVYQNAMGAFVQDSYKITPQLLLELGFRFEWNGSPTLGNNKATNYIPSLNELVNVGTNGLGRSPYTQNYNYEPRVGFAYDVFGSGKTVVRGAYGYMADQPETNVVSGLASNPPFLSKVNYNNATAPIPLSSLFQDATQAGISITAVQPNLHNAYTQDFNLNVQQEVSGGIAFSIGYYGSVGRHLRQITNLNQPNAAGVRPIQTLSAASPIDEGKSLAGVNLYQTSDIGQSNYNALWATVHKTFHNGFEFEGNYSYSKSLDLGSLYTTYLQDSTRPSLNYGPSDFDTRNRVGARAVYNLPFNGNRVVSGFRLIGVAQWQTGNPLNVVTSTTPTGIQSVAHPNLIAPITYPKSGSSAGVQWFTNSVCTQAATTPGCIFQVPTGNVLGDLHRNALLGPGFADVDVSLEKNTKIYENLNFQLRVDAFDIANHPSFGNPSLTATPGSSSFGLISSTRFPVGDSGSSRQLQFAAKLVF